MLSEEHLSAAAVCRRCGGLEVKRECTRLLTVLAVPLHKGIDAEKVAWGGCSGRSRQRRAATEEMSLLRPRCSSSKRDGGGDGGNGNGKTQGYKYSITEYGRRRAGPPASSTGKMCVATQGRRYALARRGLRFALRFPTGRQAGLRLKLRRSLFLAYVPVHDH